MTSQPKIKVYYNSACPVCKAGIETQMGKESRCEIRWNDVHTHRALVSEVSSDIEFVRERLHVIDESGNLHIGFDAFLTIWRVSAHERWKASLLGIPIVRQLCSFGYNLFAAALYRWNKVKKHW
ncbi:MAG: DUF393 domain-containing protein [Nitrosomonas sp.]|nr:DUF393 domain-containing protein [Nitrosomonas sp.]